MDKNRIGNQDVLTIEELCSVLMISQATARNWVKSGKLRPVKTGQRKLHFNKADVLDLVQSIQSGESDRLTRRRNKTKHTGNVVPAGYVAQKEYTDAAKRIIACVDTLGGGDELMRMILAEYSLKLLASRGLISCSGEVLLFSYLNDNEVLGEYQGLINDMLGAHPDKQQIKNAVCALCEPIRYIENEDFLGLLYMSISSIAKRKTEGVYYTPKRIAEDCARYLDENGMLTGKKILDPCCGTGNFLMNIYPILQSRQPGADPAALIERHLFAADIDPVSICLARVNLTLAARLADPAVLYQNLKVTDSLFDFADEAFDLIISNPPWGSAYDDAYKERLRGRFANSESVHVESFAVFLLKAIHTCKTGGSVCYVLPQSFLNVMAHDRLRGLVARHCDILRVKYWRNIFDKVYAPTITVTLRKRADGDVLPNLPILVENGGEHYRLSPARLAHSNMFNFSVSDEKNDLVIKLEEFENAARLGGNAEFALGIVTGDNKTFVKERRYREMEPVLRGTDLQAYTYRKPETFLKFAPERFQQVAPERLYRAPEKLLYKFVSSSLCFAYDDKQTLSLNSCNILIPRFETIPIKYVLAVLNSLVAHFYFSNKFQSVKVLRSHIEAIPIPVPDAVSCTMICALVDEVLKADCPRLRSALTERIDNLIMGLFDLSPAERALVRADTPCAK